MTSNDRITLKSNIRRLVGHANREWIPKRKNRKKRNRKENVKSLQYLMNTIHYGGGGIEGVMEICLQEKI